MKNVKSKKSVGAKNKTVFLTLVSFCLIIAITYMFSTYFINIYSLYSEKQNLISKIATLGEEEEKLKSEVNKLKDPEYVARYAREKFLYSKSGEFIIKLP